MLKKQIAELFLEYRQDLCDTEFAPKPFEQTTDIDLHNKYARKVLALFPQGDKIDGNALPSAAYDEYFTPPQGEGGHWIFKTDKLTPLQVMACVCQQCPFPGELETRCSWCDNPKLIEFLWLAIPAIDDFYNQSKQAALKEQMERVVGIVVDSFYGHRNYVREAPGSVNWKEFLFSTLDHMENELVVALKSQLESE